MTAALHLLVCMVLGYAAVFALTTVAAFVYYCVRTQRRRVGDDSET